MENLYLRAYTKPIKNKKSKKVESESYKNHETILVFDTETTTDIRQDLKAGFFQIYKKGILIQEGFFYKNLTKKEKDILFSFARKYKIEVYSLSQFIYQIFYPIVLKFRALCIGFNLPFDISRISKGYSPAKNNERGGFSFKLIDNPSYPRIKIKQLGSESNTIKFGYSFLTKDKFQGYFLDVQRLASIILERKRISLKNACKELKTASQKLEVEQHGKINPEYLDYLIGDVRATYECYTILRKKFENYGIKLPINKLYSNASLGKQALRQMGIKGFLEQNPNFPDEILGHIMGAYYGGRTECRIRKQPIKVTTLDFTSMYPTIMILMNLWDFITAEKVEFKDCTEEIIKFLSSIEERGLVDKKIWKRFLVLVEIEPDEDILPVRTKYNPKSDMHTIGINKLSFEGGLWYALPDIIASKLLNGKIPQIKRAIKFVAKGKQPTLQKTKILDTEFDPSKKNFIKMLVEERQKIKKKDKPKAQALKIIANATTYGIFIELNSDDKKREIDVYGNENFVSLDSKWEKQGEFFNPIISVCITSGARLLLAMVETYLMKNNYLPAYMDTDSCFVSPKIASRLSNFFQPLNPYGKKIPFLKIEKKNKWLYGISSKRYVLYDLKEGKIIVEEDLSEKDYKLHGLGHITNPFGEAIKNWHVKIWEDILKLHYGQITIQDLSEKYSKYFVISRLTISNIHILNWFKSRKDVRPYNFFLRGIGIEKGVKPISEFSKSPQESVYKPFVNLEDGKVMQGELYWKTLDREISTYLNHPESKFEGKEGILKRRHVKPKSIIYIGKESNKLGMDLVESEKQEQYANEEDLRKRILNMTPKEAEKKGVSRPTLWRIKERIRQGKKINWRTKGVMKLF